MNLTRNVTFKLTLYFSITYASIWPWREKHIYLTTAFVSSSSSSDDSSFLLLKFLPGAMLRKSVELFNGLFCTLTRLYETSTVCVFRRTAFLTFPDTSADVTITVLVADLRSAHLFSVQAFNLVKRLMGIERLVQDQKITKQLKTSTPKSCSM